MSTLPDVPDFVGIIERARTSPPARYAAAIEYARIMDFKNSPLVADHGTHHPSGSDVGRCSLEYAADVHGLLDIERNADEQTMLDDGTIRGAWLGALLTAGAASEDAPFRCFLEANVVYRETPGHVDVLVQWAAVEHPTNPNMRAFEIVEVKTTSASGAIKPPDARKLYQCLQGGLYGLSELGPVAPVAAERFTIITQAVNAGSNKQGVAYPTLAQHTYETLDYKPLVDAEIDRLTSLAALPAEALVEREKELADAIEDFRCKSCRYSGCQRNKNPMRFLL